MRQVASFPVSFTKYRAKSLEGLFPDKTLGKDLVIDPPFQANLEPWFAEAEDKLKTVNLRCLIFQTEEDENNDDFISSVFNVEEVDNEYLAGVLDYLAGEGRSHLVIPPGKDEVHLILKYQQVRAGAIEEPFVMEHEFEHGVDSIHLHVYERNQGLSKPKCWSE